MEKKQLREEHWNAQKKPPVQFDMAVKVIQI